MTTTQQQSPFHRTVNMSNAAANINVNSAEQINSGGQVSPRTNEANSIKNYILNLKVRRISHYQESINSIAIALLTSNYLSPLSQDQLSGAYDNLKDYKKLSEQYRGEIEQMRHVLEAVNQDNMSHIVPKLQLTSDTYNHAIAAQKQENALLQQRLTDLKKDKSQMQQQIDDYARRIEHMEQNIGL